jgi:hypothetical protein
LNQNRNKINPERNLNENRSRGLAGNRSRNLNQNRNEINPERNRSLNENRTRSLDGNRNRNLNKNRNNINTERNRNLTENTTRSLGGHRTRNLNENRTVNGCATEVPSWSNDNPQNTTSNTPNFQYSVAGYGHLCAFFSCEIKTQQYLLDTGLVSSECFFVVIPLSSAEYASFRFEGHAPTATDVL